MPIANIFSKKKPLYQTQNQTMSSQPIQGSGYSSAYASNPSTYKSPSQPAVKASDYSTQNYLGNMTKQTSIPKPPAQRPVGPMSTPQKVGPMSVAPKAPPMSVNPNYRKPVPQTQVQQPQPTPQVPNMSDFLQKSADKRSQLASDGFNEQTGFIKEQYGLANEQLRSQLPAAQERFGQFKGDTEAMIADLIEGGQRQKSTTEDYYGDAQRQAAQTRRETQGQTQRTFANLGTLDSRGEGSFQQATENADSEFNRFTQQTLRAKADKLSEIESAVRTGERQARQVIAQEQSKLEELSRNIEFAVANNNLSEAKELTDAYNQTINYIYDIEDSLAQAQYQFAQSQQELMDEIAKTQSFTPEFMATGNPTNQAEYEFLIKNQEEMNSLYGNGTDSGAQSKQKAINIIDQLSGLDTQGITGKMRIGFSDESRAAQGLLRQLSSELQIEEAKRLKGQGAMSDAERAILAGSIAAFNLDENGKPNISDERFKQILQDLRAGFSGQPSLSSILG